MSVKSKCNNNKNEQEKIVDLKSEKTCLKECGLKSDTYICAKY